MRTKHLRWAERGVSMLLALAMGFGFRPAGTAALDPGVASGDGTKITTSVASGFEVVPVDGSFRYDTDEVRVGLEVTGVAVPEEYVGDGAAEALAAGFDGFGVLVPKGTAASVELSVTERGEDDPAYEAVMADAAGKYGEVYGVKGLSYAFTMDGKPLDMSGCRISVDAGYAPVKVGEAVDAAVASVGQGDDLDALSVSTSAYVADGLDEPVLMASREESGAVPMSLDGGAEFDMVAPLAAAAGGLDGAGAGDGGPSAGDFENTGSGNSWIVVNEFGTWLVIGSGANPEYHVQYYAWLPVVNKSGEAGENQLSLPVFDTTGGNLPTNESPVGSSMGIVIDVDAPGGEAGIVKGTVGTVDMLTEFREIYSGEDYKYQSAPRAVYIDKVSTNKNRSTNYVLRQIWVLKGIERTDGMSDEDVAGAAAEKAAAGVNDDGTFDWDVIQSNWDMYEKEDMYVLGDHPEYDTTLVEELSQVNFVSDADDDRLSLPFDRDDPSTVYYLLITDSSYIRMVYEPIMTVDDVGYLEGGKGTAIGEAVDDPASNNFRTLSATMYDYQMSVPEAPFTFGDGSYKGGPDATGRPRSAAGINNVKKNLGLEDDPPVSSAVIGFGNGSSLTGLQCETYQGEYVNQGNSGTTGTKATVGGAVYGLVSGLESDGTIRYSDGIVVSDLFNEPARTGVDQDGKQVYGDTTLRFKQMGDTYTLQGISVVDTYSEASGLPPEWTLEHLDSFTAIVKGWSTKKWVWSNQFWPMDGVDEWSHTGGSAGGPGTPCDVWEYMADGNWTWREDRANVLVNNDDGQSHNCLFGMYYTVDFELTSDYRGPLEYLFFGDDDMWVFLSELDPTDNTLKAWPDGSYGKLICDIGGVHSSIGQYVNLWDHVYMEPDGASPSAKRYRLSFFYTERGLSGSTCYMQFTLPSVSQVLPAVTFGDAAASLSVSKEIGNLTGDKDSGYDVVMPDFGFDPDAEFTFGIGFQDESGKPLADTVVLEWTKSSGDGAKAEPLEGTTRLLEFNGADGKTEGWWGRLVTLKRGETVTVDGLPANTNYVVMESPSADYVPDVLVGGTLALPEEPPDAGEIMSPVEDFDDVESGLNTTYGKLASGAVDLTYVNRPVKGSVMPDTGGPGVLVHTIPGACAAALAVLLYARRKRRG